MNILFEDPIFYDIIYAWPLTVWLSCVQLIWVSLCFLTWLLSVKSVTVKCKKLLVFLWPFDLWPFKMFVLHNTGLLYEELYVLILYLLFKSNFILYNTSILSPKSRHFTSGLFWILKFILTITVNCCPEIFIQTSKCIWWLQWHLTVKGHCKK